MAHPYTVRGRDVQTTRRERSSPRGRGSGDAGQRSRGAAGPLTHDPRTESAWSVGRQERAPYRVGTVPAFRGRIPSLDGNENAGTRSPIEAASRRKGTRPCRCLSPLSAACGGCGASGWASRRGRCARSSACVLPSARRTPLAV